MFAPSALQRRLALCKSEAGQSGLTRVSAGRTKLIHMADIRNDPLRRYPYDYSKDFIDKPTDLLEAGAEEDQPQIPVLARELLERLSMKLRHQELSERLSKKLRND